MSSSHRSVRALVSAARLAVATPLSLAALAAMILAIAARAAVHLFLWFVVAVAVTVLLDPPGIVTLAVLGIGAAGVVVWIGYLTWAALRAATRAEPAALLAETRPPSGDTERDLAATLRELCRLVDRPTPALRLRDDRRPICYTIRYTPSASPAGTLERSSAGLGPLETVAPDDLPRKAQPDTPIPEGHAIVVSTGLLRRLSPRQREAVLAHEVAHLRNGDVALVQWLLVPVFWAEQADPTNRGPVVGRLLAPVVWLSVGLATAALIVVGRGREYGADAGAAAITGDPAALADTLRTCDPTATERPDTDSRAVELITSVVPDSDLRTVAALNVLPGLGAGSPMRYAHPPTETRIDRLRDRV